MENDYPLNSFSDIVFWIENVVLPQTREQYNREFRTFGIAFITLDEKGKVLEDVEPCHLNPADTDLTDSEEQEIFGNLIREMLVDMGGSGVMMVCNASNDYHDDRVVILLDHKGGHAIWIATGENETLDEFERDDSYDWTNEFSFGEFLSPEFVN